jgi:hypothetical protein
LKVGSNDIGVEGAKHLARALKSNMVGHFFFVFCHICIGHYSSMQTLTTVCLQGTKISGAEGALHLSDALQCNRVRLTVFPSITYDYDHSNQVLTTLNLYGNDIGDAGAKHLARALQINLVSKFFFSLLT